MNRFQQIKKIAFVPLMLCTFLLSSCGGGGGSGSAGSSTSSTAVSYKSVAQVGELISYTLDTATLSYSYRIEKSAYNLEGFTSRGTLTKNSDGTYTPSESPESRVMILPNGLLIGSIKINVNGSDVITSIVGMQNPATQVADFEDVYNYISYECRTPGNCVTSLGSVRVDLQGRYYSCADNNVANMSDIATQCPLNKYSAGKLTSNGDGTWKLMRASGNNFIEAGTFIAFKDPLGQKVAIFDLNDSGLNGYGFGSIVAASQQAVTAAATNGFYRANSSNGNYVTVTATNNAYQSYTPKFNFTEYGTLSYNDHWTGVIQAQATNNPSSLHDVIMAGSGVYISRNSISRTEIEVGIIDRP